MRRQEGSNKKDEEMRWDQAAALHEVPQPSEYYTDEQLIVYPASGRAAIWENLKEALDNVLMGGQKKSAPVCTGTLVEMGLRKNTG